MVRLRFGKPACQTNLVFFLSIKCEHLNGKCSNNWFDIKGTFHAQFATEDILYIAIATLLLPTEHVG